MSLLKKLAGLILLFFPVFPLMVFSQHFAGGSGDGHDGSTSDNFSVKASNIFCGGMGDGSGMAETVYPGLWVRGIFSGGPGDGQAAGSSINYLPLPYSIFGGGRGDGYAITSSLFSWKCTHVACMGGNTGEIQILPVTFWPPCTFAWSNGAATATVSGLSAGTYSVTVTDAAGHVSAALISITEPASLPPGPVVESPPGYCMGDTAVPLMATGQDLLWYETGTGGSGQLQPFIPQTANPGSTFYYVSQTINGCESDRVPIEVIVHPSWNITLQDTVCNGDSVFVSGAWQHDSGVFTETYATVQGCDSIIQKTVHVIPCGSPLSGWVRYKKAGVVPLKNTTVLLKQGNTVVAQTTTDDNGNYAFAFVPPGNYLLTASTGIPWGGVNAIDGLLILQHYTELIPLTGLNLTVADVDNSGYVNAGDALIAVNRFAGIIGTFAAGNWGFEKKNITITGPETQVQNIYGLCTGDVNGSYLVPQ